MGLGNNMFSSFDWWTARTIKNEDESGGSLQVAKDSVEQSTKFRIFTGLRMRVMVKYWLAFIHPYTIACVIWETWKYGDNPKSTDLASTPTMKLWIPCPLRSNPSIRTRSEKEVVRATDDKSCNKTIRYGHQHVVEILAGHSPLIPIVVEEKSRWFRGNSLLKNLKATAVGRAPVRTLYLFGCSFVYFTQRLDDERDSEWAARTLMAVWPVYENNELWMSTWVI